MPDPFRLALARFEGIRVKLKNNIPFAAVISMAAFLFLYRIGAQSYWDDEIITVAVSKAGLVQRILAVVFLDVSPPLFFILLGWWEQVSDVETWTRLLPTLFALAALYLVYLIGIKTVGRRAAFVGTLLSATLPLTVYCAQETRPYALLLFLSAFLAWSLLRLQEAFTRKRFLVAVLAGAAVLYCHYYAVFLVASLSVWALLNARASLRPFSFKHPDLAPFKSLLLAGILWLPWTGVLLFQMRAGQGWRLHLSVLEVLQRILIYYTSGHTPRVLPDLLGTGANVGLVLTLLSVPLVILVFLGMFLQEVKWETKSTSKTNDKSLLVFWLLGPMALLLIATTISPLFNERAILSYYPPAALLAGLGTVKLFDRSRVVSILLVGVLLVVAFASLRLYYFDPTYEKQNWRALTERIVSDSKQGDVVLFHSQSRELAFGYYNHDRVPVRHVFRWLPPENLTKEQKWEKILETAGDISDEFQRIWFVDYHAVAFDREGLLQKELEKSFSEAETFSLYEGVYRIEVTLYESLDSSLDGGGGGVAR